MKKLNYKQTKFVNDYLKHKDASLAALNAGYSKTNANKKARDLLSKKHIKEAIREASAFDDKDAQKSETKNNEGVLLFESFAKNEDFVTNNVIDNKKKDSLILGKPVASSDEKKNNDIGKEQENLSDTINDINPEFVLLGLKSIYERCMEAEPVTDRKGEFTGEFKFNPTGARRALRDIGEYLGMFVKSVDNDTENVSRLVIVAGDEDDDNE